MIKYFFIFYIKDLLFLRHLKPLRNTCEALCDTEHIKVFQVLTPWLMKLEIDLVSWNDHLEQVYSLLATHCLLAIGGVPQGTDISATLLLLHIHDVQYPNIIPIYYWVRRHQLHSYRKVHVQLCQICRSLTEVL